MEKKIYKEVNKNETETTINVLYKEEKICRSVGVSGGDQSAAGGVGASGGAAAGLCRELRQRQAA